MRGLSWVYLRGAQRTNCAAILSIVLLDEGFVEFVPLYWFGIVLPVCRHLKNQYSEHEDDTVHGRASI
jgi:hypothetical protein